LIHVDLSKPFVLKTDAFDFALSVVLSQLGEDNFFIKFKFCDGLLYHDGLLYILEGLVQLQLIQAKRDTLVVGYFGFNKTMELMFRDYWWPQLWKFMKEFVGSCDLCVHAKSPCHLLHGLLQPLSVPTSPWF
jgi:hypothetical protein